MNLNKAAATVVPALWDDQRRPDAISLDASIWSAARHSETTWKDQADLATYIVDGDEGARKSLTSLLRAASIRARAFPSAIAFLEQLTPDKRGCVITDAHMPTMDGIVLVKTLRDLGCAMPVIVLAGHADVPLAVAAMKAGAADFIEKPFEGGRMLAAVRLCLAVARDGGEEQSNKDSIERRIGSLTEREKQVLAAVVQGQTNKESALSLKISPRTVEIHRANMMSKMKAASLSGLVRMILTAQAG